MSKIRRSRPVVPSTGMALVAVLWTVAILSMVVTGVSTMVKQEIRGVGDLRQGVIAEASAMAVSNLVLQEIGAQTRPLHKLVWQTRNFGGQSIRVLIQPVSGLIDLNKAPERLLTSLYQYGGAPFDVATQLARATVLRRERAAERGQGMPFAAVEDLLRVPGVDYDLYAKIFRDLTVDSETTGRVNPFAATLGVVSVLTGGNSAAAQQFVQSRDLNDEVADSTGLNGEFTDRSSSGRLRLEAWVPLPDGRQWVSERVVVLQTGEAGEIPWKILHTERRIVVSGPGSR